MIGLDRGVGDFSEMELMGTIARIIDQLHNSKSIIIDLLRDKTSPVVHSTVGNATTTTPITTVAVIVQIFGSQRWQFSNFTVT